MIRRQCFGEIPTLPTLPQEKLESVEHEYERHGTQMLTTHFEVATGRIINPIIGDTRTEDDFVNHIVATVETDMEGEWIFICDQLNTNQQH